MGPAGGGDGILSDRQAGVGWIVFDNPGSHNALTPQMATALDRVGAELDADGEVRCVVVRWIGSESFHVWPRTFVSRPRTRSSGSRPAARLGLGYPLEAVRTLVSTVGPANAAHLLLTGARITAGEALRMGLVNHVIEPGDLERRTTEMANAIASNAPLSLRAAKASIRAVAEPQMKRRRSG